MLLLLFFYLQFLRFAKIAVFLPVFVTDALFAIIFMPLFMLMARLLVVTIPTAFFLMTTYLTSLVVLGTFAVSMGTIWDRNALTAMAARDFSTTARPSRA